MPLNHFRKYGQNKILLIVLLFIKDIHTNCLCASLLFTQIKIPNALMHILKSNQISSDRADGHLASCKRVALPGFNNALQCLVTSIFLLMDHFHS